MNVYDCVEILKATKDAEKEFKHISKIKDNEEFTKKYEDILNNVRYSNHSWNYKEAFYQSLEFERKFSYGGN